MSSDQKGGESPTRPQWTKEERQADAIQAKADHEAHAIAVEENTARLRALRLSKEAADLEAEKKLAASTKRKLARKKAAARKPAAAKPASSKPASSKPAASKPVAKKPVANDPAG